MGSFESVSNAKLWDDILEYAFVDIINKCKNYFGRKALTYPMS